jgi:hypothetical protein
MGQCLSDWELGGGCTLMETEQGVQKKLAGHHSASESLYERDSHFGSDKRIVLPGSTGSTESSWFGESPKPIKELHHRPERVRGQGWSWKDDRAEIKASSELVKYSVRLFLEQVERKRPPKILR